MSSDPALPGEITALLQRWGEGDSAALASIASVTYEDLRKIARGYLQREHREHTLQAPVSQRTVPPAHPAARRENSSTASLLHLFRMMMRRILTDYARRTPPEAPRVRSVRVPLHPDIAWVDASGSEMLALDQALG